MQNPVTAAVLGCVFLVGRFLYFTGYSLGSPDGRLPGSGIAYLGLFGLLGICFKAGFDSFMAAVR